MMDDDDRCYECTCYGDDWIWDEDEQDYVWACDTCPCNERDEE